MVDTEIPKHIFKDGEYALIIDRKERRYLVKLNSSRDFQTHIGNFDHTELIGQPAGTWITTTLGHNLLAIKPTMADFSREMPRIATVVYPKDMGAIIVYGDIFPGARVLEAGTGSGSVTIALMRAVGETGRVYSYDVRQDMIDQARANVTAMNPDHPYVTFKLGDVYEGFDEEDLDRIVLDLPEPWRVAGHASNSLVPGGIFVSFLPTVMQVHELTVALRREGTFELIETLEMLMRPWHVGGRSIRPSHRMVGHTGFITTARLCSPRPRATEDKDNQAQE